MPKRTDINSILIIGSGPITIGQACEFDYSGVQACKALREESYRVILINSNPATIMTDPCIADTTYIEPIHWEIVSKIIEKERPDALLPTLGGQTALNCALDLDRYGILKKFGLIMIGASIKTIKIAEDRKLFKKAMNEIGLETAQSYIAYNINDALKAVKKIGFPCIIRSSFTMGGYGSNIAYNMAEFIIDCKHALKVSPINEIIIDESLIGWKEYELEVLIDNKSNFLVICSMENIDPIGIHTGDSYIISPIQTLTDKESQKLRNDSSSILIKMKMKNGGANVQFAINPKNGRIIVIEMNPRVSRSSALASKATGFPIARLAAKLAVGYTIDEFTNEIGGMIPASFEPSLDYVVTKIPRFNFEKFIGSNNRLSTQMKSVGEVMSIGRNFQEAIQKALRGLEIGAHGFHSKINLKEQSDAVFKIRKELKFPGADRFFYIADAFRMGFSVTEVFNLTGIDSWFLVQIEELVILEKKLFEQGFNSLLQLSVLRDLKKKGFSDVRIAHLVGSSEQKIRHLRYSYNIHPVYKRIDTCAAEFPSNISYFYSTYEEECEANPQPNPNKIIILGGGPNRIGQGIEFDYCCVHAAMTLRDNGFEIIMINCNPETVSTDYDISDRLYFESITLEDVLEVVRIEKPKGIIVQYGGQTPLKLAYDLYLEGVPIIGTNPESINRAENRELFQKTITKLGLKQPKNVTVYTLEQAIIKSKEIGYPLIVRPSYVLGGRAMEIIYEEITLKHYFKNAINVSNNNAPVLLEEFLENAIEVDVDAICDGKNVLIGGIMEQIENAGVHSGDSACSLPPYTLTSVIQNKIRDQVKKLALEFSINGLINIQFAIKNQLIYLIEVNPRASRTVPFVSKATGIPLAKIASLVIIGKSLLEQGFIQEIIPPYFSVKEVVLPFNKFVGSSPILGPEMHSTGEVMGIATTFTKAFAKAILGTGNNNDLTKNYDSLDTKKNPVKSVEIAKKLLFQQGFQKVDKSSIKKIINDSTLNKNVIATVLALQEDPTKNVLSIQEWHALLKKQFN
ncbi:MAG: carbamoyl-phosphate synthase large subunit [Candidatus Dasytiphilus stammeri]